jgi:hypothetical protein
VTSDATTSPGAPRKSFEGLRINSFAAIVLLLAEFGLGVAVNLYVTLPPKVSGGSLSSAFRESVTGGPVVLALHAVLGTLLLLTGISALVRAVVLRQRWTIAVTAIAFLSIISAWLSGSKFVAGRDVATSLSMALATALTIACYAFILFALPKPVAVVNEPRT